MKNLYKILVPVFAFIALCGCERNNPPQGGNGGDIFIPSGNYIYFNVNPLSRGSLINESLPYDFSVVGYNYQSNWGTAMVQASQSASITYEIHGRAIPSFIGVFYNTQIANKKGVQLVQYDNGVHKYIYEGSDNKDNYKEWNGNLTYAFFAWYPADLGFNTDAKKSDETTIDPADYEGNPYIRYTLPTGTGARAAMKDVMTACKIDVTKYNGSSVNFDMQHRLAALDIYGNNIILLEALQKAQPGLDYTGMTDDNTIITVENITGLTLTLPGIKSKVKIPLNTNDPTEVMEAEGNFTPTYDDFNCTNISIPYYSTSDDMKNLMGDDKLILIPQEENIHAILTIKYDVVVRVGGKVKLTIPYDFGVTDSKEAEDALTTTIKGLAEGLYHYLELTFTAHGVFLQAKVEETWNELDINYSFE